MALPLPQQQQIRMMMRMIHRQEQLLFPLLKHMFCHLALRPFYAPPAQKGAWPLKKTDGNGKNLPLRTRPAAFSAGRENMEVPDV